MITFTCWMRRATGLALAVTMLTGAAYGQSGRADVKGQVVGIRLGEEELRGLPGATVELRHSSGQQIAGDRPLLIPKTGEDGKFSFEELPAGEYWLRISLVGYGAHEAKIFCARDSVTQLTVRLERSNAGQNKQRDPLPGADKITWNVKVLEESPVFAVVRRETKDRKVTWLLENTEDAPGAIITSIRADFLDADGVKIGSVELKSEPAFRNWRAGERNRFFLNLPDRESMKSVARVVISR